MTNMQSAPSPKRGDTAHTGLRSRIVQPAPPAPVPVSRPSIQEQREKALAEAASDHSSLSAAPMQALAEQAEFEATRAKNAHPATPGSDKISDSSNDKASDSEVVQAGGSMAIATLISRITGFLRNLAIGATLGSAVGSAFTVANTLPNLVTEIVLGAVLTSLVVPVLVRAEKEDPDQGAAFIRRLFTLAATLLVIVTIAAVWAAPGLTIIAIDSNGKVNTVQATSFAYLVLPQILFYGVFSLFMAVLNTKGVFKPGAWAPVWNNVVCLATFALYWLLPGALDAHEPSGITDPHVLLLGLGTTAGVVVQALLLVPPLRRLGIDLRPLWGIDARLKEFGGMAIAIVVYVAISQLGYVVTTRIASNADTNAPLIYQQAWLLLQVPYGVIGVTLLTAIMPRLSRNAAEGDDGAVVRDLTLATKLTFTALVPVIMFFMVFGTGIANALFAYGRFTAEEADILGWTLSFSAFTLIPYALVLLHLRVFYAREEAWTPTFIIAGITTVKVLLSAAAPLVATSPSKVVILLGTANGFGFVTGAVIGAFLLRRKLGSLRAREILTSLAWVVGASLVGAAVAWGAEALMRVTLLSSGHSLVQMLRTGVAGVVFLVVTALVLAKSGLPEVAAFGRLLTRVPGLGRFISPSTAEQTEEENKVPKATHADLSAQLVTVEPFTASPVPPPMSAGDVRVPRLVPGASVANGRYRLLRGYGKVPGARFWHARDQHTGLEVALVFVDTQGTQIPAAPVSPRAAARRAEEVTRATRALADLHHPAIANNIHVLPYREGCLVVADWVRGTALNSLTSRDGVPEEEFHGAHPQAVAYALSGLLDAAADAHDAGVALGVDHFDRIRVNTDGEAVLAFPAVLDTNSPEQDVRYVGRAVEQLVDDGRQAHDLKALVATLYDDPPADSRVLAEDLRAFGLSSEDDGAVLEVDADATPDPTFTPGFGSKGYTRTGMTAVLAATVGLVVVVAATSMYLLSVFGGNREDSPVNQDSLSGASARLAAVKKLVLSEATEWEPNNRADASPDWPDNPELADLVIDGDPTTGWLTDVYREQFGVRSEIKDGVGLVVSFERPATIREVQLTARTPGTLVRILGVEGDPSALTEFNETTELRRVALGEGVTTVRIDADTASEPTLYRGLVVWVERLPVDPEGTLTPADIQEIVVKGAMRDHSAESAPS